jgi:uncharacterized membrane protein SpoIIM required for sporulation
MTLLIQGESAIMFLAPDADSPNGNTALWAIIAGMVVVVILLLRVGNSIFNREELLGRTIDQLNLRATFRNISRQARAVDERGTAARSLSEWYLLGIPLSLRRIGLASRITISVFALALVAGYIVGQMPEWQISLPPADSLPTTAQLFGRYMSLPTQTGALLLIVWQNGRILLAAGILSIFTFGAASLVLTPAVYFVLGYIFSQVMLAGYNPSFLLAGVLTHGIIEIPIIVLATATALRLGAVVTRPPRGMTVGQAWSMAFGDAVKLALGVILPGLLLAAAIESFITPRVVIAVLGG